MRNPRSLAPGSLVARAGLPALLGLLVAVPRLAVLADDATWPFLAEPRETADGWRTGDPSEVMPRTPAARPAGLQGNTTSGWLPRSEATPPGVRPSYPSGYGSRQNADRAAIPSRVTSLKRRPKRDAEEPAAVQVVPAARNRYVSDSRPASEAVLPTAAELPLPAPAPQSLWNRQPVSAPHDELRTVTLRQPGLPAPAAPNAATDSSEPNRLDDPDPIDDTTPLPIPHIDHPLLRDTPITAIQATIDTPQPTGDIVPEDYADALGIGPPIYDNPDRVLDWMRDCPGPENYIFCSNPLYFEDANLERQGCGRDGLLQTACSAAYFFGTIPILPYKIGAEPPCSCATAKPFLGPCKCYTWRDNYLPPWSARGAVVQAAATTGLIFIIP